MMTHPSVDVDRALLQLSDALVSWERATGRESLLILREVGGFVYRLDNGKPIPDDLPDELLFPRLRSLGRS